MKKFFTKEVLTGATALVVSLMALNFILHMVTGWQYGLFFDEYYYYSMSGHLDFGYMDVAPLTGWLMALSRLLLGNSVTAMHVFPALAGSFAMLFAAYTAREMGGGRFSQGLTALAVMLAPMFMSFFGMFTYDVFDQMMSAAVVLLAARIIQGKAAPRMWVLLGLAAGIGLMVKITMGLLLVSLIAGILFTRARKYLKSKWFWVSIGIAAACFAPYVVWQATHGFPIYTYLNAYRDARTVSPSAPELLFYVFVTMNPASVLLWLGGLVLLFTKSGRTFRPFAWAFIAYFALAAVMSVKFYALAGAIIPLLAFGSVCLERNYRKVPMPAEEPQSPLPQSAVAKKGRGARALKVAYLAVLCLLGALLTPLNIPVLSPKATADYNSLLGYSRAVRWDTVAFSGLPTFLAARLGWDEFAQFVSQVYHSLPEDEQKDCSVYCSRYGAVGAMDYYSEKYGFPKSISANMGAYYWGYGAMDGKCVIFLNMGADGYTVLQKYFQAVEIAPAPSGVPYSSLFLTDRTLFIGRGLKIPVDAFWKAMQSYT